MMINNYLHWILKTWENVAKTGKKGFTKRQRRNGMKKLEKLIILYFSYAFFQVLYEFTRKKSFCMQPLFRANSFCMFGWKSSSAESCDWRWSFIFLIIRYRKVFFFFWRVWIIFPLKLMKICWKKLGVLSKTWDSMEEFAWELIEIDVSINIVKMMREIKKNW